MYSEKNERNFKCTVCGSSKTTALALEKKEQTGLIIDQWITRVNQVSVLMTQSRLHLNKKEQERCISIIADAQKHQNLSDTSITLLNSNQASVIGH